jgi:uncharacterized membrane protein YkoI
MSIRSARRRTTPFLALALGLSLAGCAGENDRNEATPGDNDEFLAGSPGGNRTALPGEDATVASSPEASPADDGSEDDGSEGEAAGIGGVTTTALQAIAAAEEEAGGDAYSIDDADDDSVWEVDVAVGDRTFDVEVDDNGEVVGTEEGALDSDERAVIQGAEVGLAEAIELIQEEGSGALDEAELDIEGDHADWAVTLVVKQGEIEYRVDTESGEVRRGH